MLPILPNRRDVERRLRDLMRHDKARVKLGRISENGILELTRQRLRQSHSLISRVICQSCSGTGRVRDAQGLSLTALRKIAGYLSKKRVQLAKLKVRVPIDVANMLNNSKRKELITRTQMTSKLISDILFSSFKVTNSN